MCNRFSKDNPTTMAINGSISACVQRFGITLQFIEFSANGVNSKEQYLSIKLQQVQRIHRLVCA